MPESKGKHRKQEREDDRKNDKEVAGKRNEVNPGKNKELGKRSVNYGFDFDLDEIWGNRDTPDKKNSGKSRSKKKLSSKENSEENEFDLNADIFREKEDGSKNGHGSFKNGQKNGHSSPQKFDAFGRELNGEDLDSSWAGMDIPDISPASSNFSTMSKIELSNHSSASSHSRHSSNSVALPLSRHSRSFSSNSLDTRLSPRIRRSSVGSVLSTSSQSPGLPRKVRNSANCLTPGLGGQKNQSKKQKNGSRGHSPSF